MNSYLTFEAQNQRLDLAKTLIDDLCYIKPGDMGESQAWEKWESIEHLILTVWDTTFNSSTEIFSLFLIQTQFIIKLPTNPTVVFNLGVSCFHYQNVHFGMDFLKMYLFKCYSSNPLIIVIVMNLALNLRRKVLYGIWIKIENLNICKCPVHLLWVKSFLLNYIFLSIAQHLLAKWAHRSCSKKS